MQTKVAASFRLAVEERRHQGSLVVVEKPTVHPFSMPGDRRGRVAACPRSPDPWAVLIGWLPTQTPVA